MFFYLILLFTILPALELAILIKVGSIFGVTWTILLIILTGVLGVSLAKIQGLTVLNKINSSLENGIMPTEEMLDGLLVFVGGILLLTPGFITDILGLLLLIPWSRSLTKLLVKRIIQTSIDKRTFKTYHHISSSRNSDNEYEDADFY